MRDSRTGKMRSLKTPTTPPHFANGVLMAIRLTGTAPGDITDIAHGMTVATNTALEMNGAKLGVITTRGFRDVLVVGRGNRTTLYDIKTVRPPPLVPRQRILEVDERMTGSGDIHMALDEDQVAAACKRLTEMGVEAVAVCFLHSYANAEHEKRAAEIVRSEMPGISISVSSEILPEYREFERFSTTALNAYVGPKVSQYLDLLASGLTDGGINAPLRIMGSNGGTWSAAAMAQEPVNAMLSGPAGGVTASIGIARLLDVPDIITYDMGGTSTDACLIRNYEYGMTTEGHVGMWPNRAPQIEIKTVGAGGGSIAYLAPGKFLNVGPRSSGAIPGPACYGRGGTEPTVTDANVVLGRFRPDLALGGEIELDEDAAREAVASLGKELGLTTERTAEGVVRLAVSRMTATVKEISVMRGLDPRDFTLFAYGGAGPLHAAAIAEELGITEIVIPPMPGAFSAYGLLTADTRYDVTRTRLTRLSDITLEDLQGLLEPLREEARERLRRDGFDEDNIQLQVYLDIRFVGQAFELTTPMPEAPQSLDEIAAAFQEVYEERYAQSDTAAAEIVSFRVVGLGKGPSVELPEHAGDDVVDPETRPVSFDSMFMETAIYNREALPVDTVIAGPAIIEEDGATTVVPPGFSATMDVFGILTLRRANHD
jgi:N-methylhydantoinase A